MDHNNGPSCDSQWSVDEAVYNGANMYSLFTCFNGQCLLIGGLNGAISLVDCLWGMMLLIQLVNGAFYTDLCRRVIYEFHCNNILQNTSIAC